MKRPPGGEPDRGSPAPRGEPSLVDFVGAMQVRSLAVYGLLLLAAIYFLHFTATVMIPLAMAVLFKILLSPVVRRLQTLGLPAPVGAGLLVTGLVLVMGLGVYFLAQPAQEWIREAPTSIREMRDQMTSMKTSLEDIQKISEEMEDLGELEQKSDVQAVKLEDPGILENVLDHAPRILALTVVFIFLCYFFLSSGDNLMRKLAGLGRNFSERKRVILIGRQVQARIAQYLATITVINAGLGLAVALVMWWLGVPNPLLWGTMAGLLNFAPYLGAMVSLVVLALVGLTTFDNLGQAMMVPGAFLVLTTLEGQLITPTVVGRHLAISPAVVLLAVIAWGWLWGVVGALIAVPMLVSVKVTFEHVPSLKPLADLMER